MGERSHHVLTSCENLMNGHAFTAVVGRSHSSSCWGCGHHRTSCCDRMASARRCRRIREGPNRTKCMNNLKTDRPGLPQLTEPHPPPPQRLPACSRPRRFAGSKQAGGGGRRILPYIEQSNLYQARGPRILCRMVAACCSMLQRRFPPSYAPADQDQSATTRNSTITGKSNLRRFSKERINAQES